MRHHAARRLLPARRHRRRSDATQRRFGDGDAERLGRARRRAAPSGPTVRVGAAIHSVRAVDPDGGATVARVGGRARAPAARPRLRAAGRERGLPGDATAARRPSCSPTPARSAERFTAVHATHLDRRRRRAARRRAAATVLPLPDDRARPRRRHRPGAPARATPARALAARQRLARRDRPLRGGARGRARRAAGHRRARAPRRADAARGRGDARRLRRLGWPEAGRIEAGALGRPVTTVGLDSVAPGRAPTPSTRSTRSSSPRRAADVATSIVGGQLDRRATAPTRRSTSRRELDRRDRDACAREHARHRQHRPARHQRPRARRRAARARARRRARDRGRPGRRRSSAPGARRRRAPRRRRPLRHPRLRRQPHAPRLRRRPRRRVRGADGGRAVRGRRHPRDDRRDARAARPTSSRALARRRARTRRVRAGITHVEIKSGYGLDVGPSERAAARSPAELTDDVTFLGAHVVPAEYEGRADDYVDARLRRDARRLRAARAAGSTSSASAARSTPSSRARCSRPGAPPGSGCACTATSSAPGPGVRLAVELGAASVDHCTYLERRRRRGAGRQRHRRHVPARDRLLDPPALSRRPPRDRRRRHASRSRPTATPARATRPRWRSASRSRCATWA